MKNHPVNTAFLLASVATISGLATMLFGCSPSPPQLEPVFVQLDPRPPQLDFVLDLGAVEQTHQWLYFDDRASPLRTGNGWSENRYSGGFRGLGHHAWASRRASLIFRSDRQRDLELIFRAQAYGDSSQQDQFVHVWLNDSPVERWTIPRHWVNLQVRLPADVVRSGLNTIDFRFDWDVNPHTTNPSAENRFMSAVFTAIGVVPSDLSLHASQGSPAGFVPGTDHLVLSPGGEAWLAISGLTDLNILPLSFEAGGLQVAVANPRAGESHTESCVAPCRDGFSLIVRGGDEVVIGLNEEASTPVTVRLDGRNPPEQPLERTLDEREPDVLVYVVDTLRADASSVGGRRPFPSGQIADFVDSAVRFESARTTAPWTLPATWSLLSGQYPTFHGFRKAASRPKDLERFRTLGERLSSVGYRTIAASQSYIIGRTYGFDRGFDDFTLCDRLGSTRPRSEDARWIAWHGLRATPPDTPAFLYVHTVEPHAPYSPVEADEIVGSLPADLRTKISAPASLLSDGSPVAPEWIARARDLYLAEAREADLGFGETLRLMGAFGRLENSIIVFTSDHGEEFFEHGGFDHSRTLFDELLVVPLAVRFPDLGLAGTHTGVPASLVDVVPTVIAAAGLPPDSTLPGFDLRRLVENQFDNARVVAAETDPEGQKDVWAEVALRCAVVENIKCIVSDGATNRNGQPLPSIRCFDLDRDPEETTPLDGSLLAGNVETACIDSVAKLMPRSGHQGDEAESAEVSEEVRAKLRALGYLGN